MSELPLDAAGRRPAFFDEPGVDQLVSMVLELATELWVIRERVYAIEDVATRQGLDLSAMERWTPDTAQQAELAQMRARILENMFRTLRQEHRPVSRSEPAPGGPAATDPT
jgi:hypothetical protein